MNTIIEICTDNVESAITAQKAGAGRIELCAALPEGGTTPSAGMIKLVRSSLEIPVNVIIRPRGGDFMYSAAEFEVMRRDIALCGEYGVSGIVTGILLSDGRVDTDRMAKLMNEAAGMSVTFHRAFDLCSNPEASLEDIISLGADRLLTSGQCDKAAEGAGFIRKLVQQAAGRIIIMPGSGITLSNIEYIARETGAKEFHLTGRKTIDSEMLFRRENVMMGSLPGQSEYSLKTADGELIKSIIARLKMI